MSFMEYHHAMDGGDKSFHLLIRFSQYHHDRILNDLTRWLMLDIV